MSEDKGDFFDRSFSEEMQAVADTVSGAEVEQGEADLDVAAPDVEAAAPEAATEPPAEAKERRDWKGEAIRLEERLKALEAARVAPDAPKAAAPTNLPPVPDPIVDPEGFARHHQFVAFNERLNVSEMMLREKHDDVDAKIDAFKAEAAQNPALMQRLQAERHPWKWAYEQGAKALARREIGDDPEAFKAKVRSETEAELRARIREEVMAEVSGTPRPASAGPAFPPDLTGARSVSGRSSVPVQKPAGFDALFGGATH